MMEDLDSIMFTKEQLANKTKSMGRIISKDYEGKDLVVVGILKGAAIFTMDLVREITCPARLDFMSVSSYGGGTSSSGVVKIRKDLEADIKGKDVLICEDIIDSGITMKNLIPMLMKREPASIRLCALLSKPSRREVDVQIDYLGWEVPDAFLVGYGLDYAEKYRNLPLIGVLKREIYA